jgi:non-homologous end joining protein Ku
MRVIKAKLKGKQAHLVSDEPRRDAKVVDLMERLRQSLERSTTRPGRSGAGRRKAKERPAARRRTRHRAA